MTITKEAVCQALIDSSSAEPDEALGGVTYYLHITDEGEILPTFRGADETFTYTIRSERDYFGDDAEHSMDDYYSKESPDDPDFEAIVEALTDAANAYLANL